MFIRAIYYCPKLNSEILIYDDKYLHDLKNKNTTRETQSKIQLPAHIHRLIGRRASSSHLKRTIKLIPAKSFLEAVSAHKCKMLGVPTQSFRAPESLELLSICLQKSLCTPDPLNSVKILDEVSEQDVIEIFI